jgi:hypothetical protein
MNKWTTIKMSSFEKYWKSNNEIKGNFSLVSIFYSLKKIGDEENEINIAGYHDMKIYVYYSNEIE